MSDKLKMISERLVDVFEQMLGVAEELTCQKKKGKYAHCILKMKEEGIKERDMLLGRMCAPCRALWHLQLGKEAWVEAVKKKYPDWEPMDLIPEKDRVYQSPLDRSGRG